MSKGNITWNYTYDANGMRTSRTNGTKTYNYVYNGSQLTQMTVGSDTLYFTYGAMGPATVTWDGYTYYYVLNSQGDVTAILDEDGIPVVWYNWNTAWGYNPEPEGLFADTLGELNPLRYRSYVYDTETGYYYLQSRYYAPEISRFINADGLVATGQGLLGNNMFAYCLNNPVNGCDPCGSCFHRWDFWNDCAKCGGKTIGDHWNDFTSWCNSAYNYVTNADPQTAKKNLEKDHFTFYRGSMVFTGSLPVDRSAFSFGIIVLDDYYLDRGLSSFTKTLNHEYGHFVHMLQLGLPRYTTNAAVPSLISAAVADPQKTGIPKWLSDNYYNLPWERVADYWGGVDRGYSPNANYFGVLYWLDTIIP